MAKKTSSMGKMAAGVGIAALAATAAAAYYLSGPSGKKHRKQIGAWAKKAKAEMVGEIKKMKVVSKSTYEKAAKEVMAKYKQAKNVKPEELKALGKELQSHWNKISKTVAALGKKK